MGIMKYGINLNSVLPVRKLDNETSELVSQLLFGEFFEIIEIKENWCFISNFLDDYKGWVDKKMISSIDKKDYELLVSMDIPTLISPSSTIKIMPDNEKMILSAGSLLPNYENGICKLFDKSYHIAEESVAIPALQPENNLVTIALSFLNVPYLWGGKNCMGMDCSGFVQIVFRINGILLPRDASQQALHGTIIHTIEYAEAGDLAFFSNEEKNITHVGIILENKEIIHESGKVRIDTLDEKGIFNTETSKYTHKLRQINRYF